MILSDNGTQMVGAEKELRKMIEGWNTENLREYFANTDMECKFITPAAPHQNGCAEALVKSCKIALTRAIWNHNLTPLELYTCLLEVANLVNKRPIGRVPNDPDDGAYLRPNDMLLGRASPQVPQRPFCETRNPRRRVAFIHKIVDSFWRRWTRDVFPLLVPCKKWNTSKRNVRERKMGRRQSTGSIPWSRRQSKERKGEDTYWRLLKAHHQDCRRLWLGSENEEQFFFIGAEEMSPRQTLVIDSDFFDTLIDTFTHLNQAVLDYCLSWTHVFGDRRSSLFQFSIQLTRSRIMLKENPSQK